MPRQKDKHLKFAIAKKCHVFNKMDYNSKPSNLQLYLPMHGLEFNEKIRIHFIFLTVDHFTQRAHTNTTASASRHIREKRDG